MSSDEDMFDDLEQTLQEGLRNLRFPSETEEPSEIDVSILEKTHDLKSMNGPAVRSYNLIKAALAFKEKKYLDSIFFETFALSLNLRIRFHANKIMEIEDHLPTEENLENFLGATSSNQPEFVSYIDRFLMDRPIDNSRKVDFANGKELMELCSELPEEWTVVQLCKQVNTEIYGQTRDEALRYPNRIYITLFRYPMSHRFNHQPIKLLLDNENLKDLYESIHDLSELIDTANTYVQVKEYKDFDTKIVKKMKDLLGPWIVCFSGKSRPEYKQIDNDTIAIVDKLLASSRNRYSDFQKTLICLIALRVYMITEDDIDEAAYQIADSSEQQWDLQSIFRKLQLKVKNRVERTYPVILVVDEHIDFMYWEMCNPSQEFTRVDSIFLLLTLYFHHKNNISEGYFNIKERSEDASMFRELDPNGPPKLYKACAVIDPDLSLNYFQKKVGSFVEAAGKENGSWVTIVGKEPQFKDIKSMLACSQVYLYCGHGSGLQFISAYETCQLATNAVVFLMGCSSVKFRAGSGYAMATASHHHYHVAKSPAIVGHLNVTYTNLASLSATAILGKWISSMTDMNLEIEDTLYMNKLKEVYASLKPSPYLTDVISQYKNCQKVPIVFRAILCYRGLPVKRSYRT
ncbi:Separin [Pseudolycoriella hygida]|uniref:separase n=1 Tax=Pseudolycoriella hygida TaxID=35572 RepID=A0A9Q0RX55_9DIPT|nr:Separin [Pseudolycoriella hygida]